MELNAEKVVKGLECCSADTADCHNCPYSELAGGNCFDNAKKDALVLVKSQEQRIKELTAKITKWEEECDLRGDMWCKLNEENKRLTDENEEGNKEYKRLDREYRTLNAMYVKLTEENKHWQKELITQKENADKAYYELACEVENLRAENERLSEDNEIKSQKRANIFEIANAYERGKADTVRQMQDKVRKKIKKTDWLNGRAVYLEIDQIAKEILEKG